MREDIWAAVMRKAQLSALAARKHGINPKAKRYVVADPWRVGAQHGWLYRVVSEQDYRRLRPKRTVRFCSWCPVPAMPDERAHPNGQDAHVVGS